MNTNIANQNSIDGKIREEFTMAYKKYYPLLFNIIFLKIGNEENAADLCQQIFIIFLQKFTAIDDYRKWLFGTLKNVLYKYYAQKKPDVDIDSIFEDAALTFVNGFKDTRILITEIIESIEISDDERLILDYITYYNYSYANIGRIMGLSAKQVNSRYMKIVQKVANMLKEKGINSIEELL